MCEGCIYFHPERDRRPCGILSGGQCIEGDACAVRSQAPAGIWVQRMMMWQLRLQKERRDAELCE